MKQIKDVPKHELIFQLRKLQAIAREVAYAKTETDMEYFTMHYLRPQLEKLQQFIGKNNEQSIN